MPELPEVETVVRDLRPQLSGRRIELVQLTRDSLIQGRLIRYPTARQFVQRLRGRTITSASCSIAAWSCAMTTSASLAGCYSEQRQRSSPPGPFPPALALNRFMVI